MTEKFKKLINPKTDNYYKLKQYVLGGGINWFYAMYSTPPNEKSDNDEFYVILYISFSDFRSKKEI